MRLDDSANEESHEQCNSSAHDELEPRSDHSNRDKRAKTPDEGKHVNHDEPPQMSLINACQGLTRET